MRHSVLPFALLSLGLLTSASPASAGPGDAPVRFASLPPGDALRDAVRSGVSLREAPTVEAKGSALRGIFDGGRLNASAGAVRDSGRRRAGPFRAWRIEPDFGTSTGLHRFRTSDPKPGAGRRLRSAVSAALEPFKAAMGYAWGGAWTGAAALRALDVLR